MNKSIEKTEHRETHDPSEQNGVWALATLTMKQNAGVGIRKFKRAHFHMFVPEDDMGRAAEYAEKVFRKMAHSTLARLQAADAAHGTVTDEVGQPSYVWEDFVHEVGEDVETTFRCYQIHGFCERNISAEEYVDVQVDSDEKIS
jgi:hypothetical protein